MANILDALRETRGVLENLESDHVFGTRELRARVDLLERTAMMLESETLTKLALEVRDDAIALRRRHRVMQRVVSAMMD